MNTKNRSHNLQKFLNEPVDVVTFPTLSQEFIDAFRARVNLTKVDFKEQLKAKEEAFKKAFKAKFGV